MATRDTGRKPESAWEWFEREDVEGQTHPRASCLRCSKVFNSAQYGRDLVPHVAYKCPDALPSEQREARDLIAKAEVAKRQKRNVNPPLSPRPTPRKSRKNTPTPDKGRPSPYSEPLTSFELRHSTWRSRWHFMRRAAFFAPPGTRRPSRKALSNQLLEEVYQTVRDQMFDWLRRVDGVSLVTDGWTNPNNVGIMNFILTSPEMDQPVFWSSVPTQAASHTADYIASKIQAVIQDVEGCAAHHTNLLIKDLFKKVKLFETVLTKAIFVSKFVLKRQAFLYTFRMAQVSQDVRRTLALPVETRWYSHAIFARSVIENKSALLAVFNNTELIEIYKKNKGNVEKLAQVKDIIADETFWAHGSFIIQLVKPITDALALLEANRTPLSEVYRQFELLLKHRVYSDSIFGLDAEVQTLIRTRIGHRITKATSSTARVAYILDPRFPLADDVRNNLLAEIETIVSVLLRIHPHASEAAIREDLSRFLEQKIAWQTRDFEESAKYHPKQWWNFSPHAAMRDVVKTLFSVPASSAASEWSWSVHSLIHTERRSRLRVDRVEKLVFIYSNASDDKKSLLSYDDHENQEGIGET